MSILSNLKLKAARWLRLLAVSGCFLALALLLLPRGAKIRAQGYFPLHSTTDWSNRHLVFSAPSSMMQAWRLQAEPRYLDQWVRLSAQSRVSEAQVQMPDVRDWAEVWGGDHEAAMEDHDGNRDEDDAGRKGDEEDRGGDRDDADRDRERDDREREGRHRHHHHRDPAGDPAFHTDWGMSLLAGGAVEDEMFPAKFTFDVNAAADCTKDFVVFNTSLAGSATVSSILAFNHLYSTQGSVGGFCNQNGPTVMWAYNTNHAGNTNGTNVTSPALSRDGTQVVFVETRTNANGGSVLHILKWLSGQGTLAAPATPNLSIAAWSACTAGNSCMVDLTFNGAQQDTNSSPFYVYTTDTIYVGDNNGVLHKFTPVLSGTPAEVTSGGWPITVHGGTVLSSPVYDSVSENIFIGDASGRISYVRETGSTTGACGAGSPPCLGNTTIALTGSIVDGPLVDSSTKRVLWFDGQDTTNHGEVVQTDTALGNRVTLTGVGGSGGTPTSNMHAGAFDHTYLTSPSNNIAGFLYFCGKNAGANRDRPSLWRVGFSATGVMNTTPDGGAAAFLLLASPSGEECSPVSELNNGATDRIFLSVGQNSTQAACPAGGGCVMSLNLGGAWPPAAMTHAVPTPIGPNLAVTGGNVREAGTSGIVVDNVSSASQASNIYFSFEGNSVAGAQCNGVNGLGCAVKLTQSGLN